MNSYTITDKCIGCTLCAKQCPVKAIDGEIKQKHTIDADKCISCGLCGRVCPQGIPLHLLNRKIIKDMNELYGEYQAGEEIGQRHPLTDFTFDDVEPSIVHERGGAK